VGEGKGGHKLVEPEATDLGFGKKNRNLAGADPEKKEAERRGFKPSGKHKKKRSQKKK